MRKQTQGTDPSLYVLILLILLKRKNLTKTISIITQFLTVLLTKMMNVYGLDEGLNPYKSTERGFIISSTLQHQ